MDLFNDFQQAVKDSKLLPSQDNISLLKMYSLFKQSTVGDINIEKPTNIYDIIGQAKYGAWAELKGMSKESAMMKYIEFINHFSPKEMA